MVDTQEQPRKRSRFGDAAPSSSGGASALSAQEKAKQIAAKLSAIAGMGENGGEKGERFGDAATSGAMQIRKKVYVPVREYPDVNFIGLLIGPNGQQHRSLEESSGAKISIKGRGSQKNGGDEGDEDLHVLIVGDREDQVRKAEDLVRDILFDPSRASNLKRKQLSDLAGGLSHGYGDPNLVTVDVEVKRTIIGAIIGKRGEQIRDLKDQSGAQLQVEDPPETNPPAQTCTISIKGRKDCVERAESLLRKLIDEKEAFYKNQQLSRQGSFGGDMGSKQRFTMHVADDKVGLVIGKGGMTIKGIQNRSRCKIEVPHAEDPAKPGYRELIIFADNERDFEDAKQDIMEATAPIGEGSGPSSAGNGMGTDYGGSGNETYGIPNDKVGLVIGRGGETIKRIQTLSGCRIQVPKEPDSGGYIRTLSLSGTREQCDTARKEIDQVLQQYHQQGSTGGSKGYQQSSGGDYGLQQQQYGAQPVDQYQYAQWQQYYAAQAQQQQQQQQQSAQPSAAAGAGQAAAGAGETKYTQEEWTQWRAYYKQFGVEMPETVPPHLSK
mmetsp:Transcript_16445/g.26745  ORF Transcript_16445/g.26745 Transcript_16445/m.26745 type:complete len:551 (+) Transcript_16445:17-1669(+)